MNSKQILVQALDKSGLAWLMQPVCAGRGVIAGLHRVTAKDHATLMPGNDISVELLRDILTFLKRAGYEFVSLAEIPERMRSRSGRRFAAFTFDDGYLDNLTLALPVFRDFQAPFAIFPVTGIADGMLLPWWVVSETLILNSDSICLPRTGDPLHLPSKTYEEKLAAYRTLSGWGYQDPKACSNALEAACKTQGMDAKAIADQAMLSWNHMREMLRDPLVTFGVHTVSHLGLSKLPEHQAIEEIAVAQERLQSELGVPIRHIAYPFGWYGEREIRIVKDLRFNVGVTVERGTIRSRHADHLLALPRVMPSMAAHANSMAFVRASVYGLWNDVINLVTEPRR